MTGVKPHEAERFAKKTRIPARVLTRSTRARRARLHGLVGRAVASAYVRL
jgi:hypothetical protein